jgi:signal transduction histidine kinase/ActR/RegA family two-component response regulator
MQGGPDLCAFSPEDRSRRVLDFVHGLLGKTGPETLCPDSFLAGLAEAFGATGAGAAVLPDSTILGRSAKSAAAPPRIWPWQIRPELVTEASNSALALSVRQGGDGAFLLTVAAQPIGLSYVVWVETPDDRAWTKAEQAALVLAAQVLGRGENERRATQGRSGRLDQAARRRRLEDAALVARRVCHDVGNLLTGIQGFTELALAQLDSDSPALVYVKEINQAVQHANHVTGQMRLFSRRTPGSTRPSHVTTTLAEEEARFRQAPGAAALALEIDASPDLPAVALTTESVRTILGHVLDNAREAIKGSGKVTLRARLVQLHEADCADLLGYMAPGPHVEISVRDDGCGLSPEARQRLFTEPFFTDKPRHRGLGLAVAYGILCAHKGGLSVETGSEYGTVVRLLLPVAGVSTLVEPARPYRPGLVRGEKVLVVDDDPMILKLCSATLEQAGYRVYTAGDATEALDSYQAAVREPFRLVVSDVVMPRMTGVDLARRLRNQDATLGVLFMSGQVGANLPNEEFVGGPCDFLPKPFRPDGLLNAVRTALDRAARPIPAGAGGPR